jgi:hypothetical protein
MGGLLLFWVWFFHVLRYMYSSSFPYGLDGFERLDIGDDYDMAPRTRQQSRAGAQHSEGEFYYTVDLQLADGTSTEVVHSYDLAFEPVNPNPLRDAISFQGRNLSYDIKVSQVSNRVQFDLLERVSIWVQEGNGNTSFLQCNCSHQMRDTACKVCLCTNLKNIG